MSRGKEDEKSNRHPQGKLWRPVDRGIWQVSHSKWYVIVLERIVHSVRSVPFVFLAPLIIFFVPISFLLVLSLVGPIFFGPALILTWAGLLGLFVFVTEKSGHAKVYESWDFPLARILFLPIGFLFAVGLILFMLSISHLGHL